LPDGGVLLLSESVLNAEHSASTPALMKDLAMMIACDSGAGERNEAEYRALIEAAGFHFVETIRMDAPRDLLVAKK
jgi:hypothetical protein